jgi:hypothetical protein
MKKLKISINSAAIPAGYNYTHIATSYQVSTSYDFEDNDVIYQSLKNKENLTDITTTVEDKYEQLWIRTKYHYSSPSGNVDSYWSIPQEINDNNNKTDFYNSVVISYTPIVKYNKDELGNINLSTSDFNLLSGVGEHESTNWKIKDKDENLVYLRKDDKNNLTNITPTIKLNDDNVYIVEASHSTYPTSTSYPGRDIIFPINPNGSTFDFSLISGFKITTKCWYNINLNVNNFSSYDIMVKDNNDNTIVSKSNIRYLTDYINTNICSNNTPYYIYIRISFEDNKKTNWVKYGPYVNVGDNNTNSYCNFFVEGPDTDIQGLSNINSYSLNINNDELFFFIKNDKVVTYVFTGTNVEFKREVLDLSSYNLSSIPEASFIDLGNSELLIHIKLKDNSSLFLLCLIINPLTLELQIVDEHTFKDDINLLGVVNKPVTINNKTYFPFDVGYSNIYREGLHLVAIDTLHNQLRVNYINLSSNGKWINPVLATFNNNMYVINGGKNVSVSTSDINYTLENFNVYLANIRAGDSWSNNPIENIDTLTLIGTLPDNMSSSLNDLIAITNNTGILLLNNCYSGNNKLDSIIITYNITNNNNEYILLDNTNFHNVPFRNTIKMLNGDILRISSDIKGNGLRNQVSYILPTLRSIYAESNQEVTNPLNYTTSITDSDYDNNIKLLKPYHIQSDTNYIRPTIGNNLTWKDDRESISLDYNEVIITKNINTDKDIKNMRGLNILANSSIKLVPGSGIGDHNSFSNKVI